MAILLSTWNGARFLPAQLDSLLQQTQPGWTLLWRDDGSSDDTEALMGQFASGPGAGRCIRLDAQAETRLGVTGSFLALLRASLALGATATAFADQDDVWLPDKLARGLAALAPVPAESPALYCARQMLVDEHLRRIGPSPKLPQPPPFPAALTQNIATGCTVMLNQVAARLVATSHAPPETLHDWWSYVVVTAAGGRVLVDDTPVILYRQHARNVVGAPAGATSRARAALRRGPARFMAILRAHVQALEAQPDLPTPTARAHVATLARALQGGVGARLAALRIPGLRRQTWPETLLFRAWFLLG